MIVLATARPLFEWQISELVTDFPPTHQVYISPFPWKAQLVDSIEDGSFVFKKIFISRDNKSCLKEDLHLVVNRSPKDKFIEQVWLDIYSSTSWLLGWSWIEVMLCAIYILWFTIWYKQGTAFHAVILIVISLYFFLNLTQILRIVAPLSHPYIGRVDCYHGTVTFTAVLSRVYYGTPILLLVGILSELGGMVVIVYQIMMAQRRESAQSTAG